MEELLAQGANEQARERLKKALECLLFVATKPLPHEEIARIMEIPSDEALTLLNELAAEYERRSGLAIVEVAGGWRMVTRPEFAPYISRLHPPQRTRLSRSSLEVLAIIAYHQPITRPEIDQLRGVDSSAAIQSLLEHGLIQVVGHKDTVGRPRLYATTQKFLELFGLRSLDEIPPLREWQEQAAKLLEEAKDKNLESETLDKETQALVG